MIYLVDRTKAIGHCSIAFERNLSLNRDPFSKELVNFKANVTLHGEFIGVLSGKVAWA